MKGQNKIQGWKVGDSARCLATITVSSQYQQEMYAKGALKTPLEVGEIYEVTKVTHVGEEEFISVVGHGVSVHGTYGDQFIKVGSSTITMKITNLVKSILDSDTRTLIKAGFINGDLALTDEGRDELLGIILLDKKADLVKIAQEKLNDTK